MADDDVVEELHTKERSRFLEPASDTEVFGARLRVTARMIVGDHDRGGFAAEKKKITTHEPGPSWAELIQRSHTLEQEEG